jgi:hypothetical protein
LKRVAAVVSPGLNKKKTSIWDEAWSWNRA